MVGGGGKPPKRLEELGPSSKDNGKGGRHTKSDRIFLKYGCAGDTYFWVGDVSYDPLYGTGPGGVSTQSRQSDQWEATKVSGIWELGTPAAGDYNSGGGVQGYGGVYSEEEEYIHTIHCNAADSGTMRGDGTDDSGMGS